MRIARSTPSWSNAPARIKASSARLLTLRASVRAQGEQVLERTALVAHRDDIFDRPLAKALDHFEGRR